MRKFALAMVALAFSFGIALAGEVTFLGYDKEKKELKVKDGDNEVVLKVTDKTTFKRGDMDVPNDKGVEALVKMDSSDKAKGKSKFEATYDKDKKEVTEIKMKGKKAN